MRFLNFKALLPAVRRRRQYRYHGSYESWSQCHGTQDDAEDLNLMNRRRLERAALDVVKLNEVNVAQRSLAEVAERLHLGIRIVDAFDHGILIGRAAASLLGVELKRLVKAKQRVLLNTGHELIARRLDGGMQ